MEINVVSFVESFSTEEVLERIRTEVEHPIHTNVLPMSPMGIAPQAVTGELKAGDKLFLDSGVPEFTQNHHYLDEDEVTRVQWEWSVRGYWSVAITNVLKLPFPMRGLVPVWIFMLHGAYTHKVFGDREEAEQIEDHIARAAKRAKEHRGQYFPRGAPFAADGLFYETNVEGDFKRFSGEEQVHSKKGTLWEARFSGGLLIPIS